MTKIDYNSVGLKIGFEWHQQLSTKKLFCNCDSKLINNKPDFELKRNLLASLGETGTLDIAAKHEIEKEKHFIYQGYTNKTCLVELDEEPPHEVNKNALYASIQMAKMLNCTIIDSVQFMRKIVLNGSNTSGFQRTGLIAIDGILNIDTHKIRIDSICLEEDSARDIEKKK